MSIKINITFRLNGEERTVETDPAVRMLDVVRELLNQRGTKEGCGIGECGACTVLADGQPVNSCITPVGQLEGSDILTIEGLREDAMADVIKACFTEEGAVQCGYCTPGMILSAYALLKQNPEPDRDTIKTALSGNLCRCTGYIPIIRAVELARERISEV